MPDKMDFEQVLTLFEAHGWALQKIWPPYRVFVKEGELPWLIPVHNNEVDYEYVEKIWSYFEQKDPPGGE